MVSDAMAAEMAAGTFLFNGADGDRSEQYGAHTAFLTGSQRVSYSKGGDHIIDADRCAYYAARTDLFSIASEPPVLGLGFEAFGPVPTDFERPTGLRQGF